MLAHHHERSKIRYRAASEALTLLAEVASR